MRSAKIPKTFKNGVSRENREEIATENLHCEPQAGQRKKGKILKSEKS